MIGARFTGVIYVDGQLFTHPGRLMGAANTTRAKVVKELRENVRETLTDHYISQHTIELHVCDRQTKQVETINY